MRYENVMSRDYENNAPVPLLCGSLKDIDDEVLFPFHFYRAI